MARWLRFEAEGVEGFGTLDGDTVAVHTGNMFASPAPTGQQRPLSSVRLLAPCRPTKMIAMWNNFHALGKKLGLEPPAEPLFLIKAPNCYEAPGATIRRPRGYDGKVVFEGELVVVIGTPCTDATPEAAAAAIFGYTCVNDITAADILTRDPTFPQWARAKSFDGFGPFGPVIATGLDPAALVVRTILNGAERQNYPIADMVFAPAALVSKLSRDMTLLPGDLICCGTSLGVGAMRETTNDVQVMIDGIGSLANTYVNA